MPGVVGKYDPHGAKSRPEKKGTAEVMRPFFCAGGGNIHFIGTLTQGNQILNFMAPLALVDKADQVLNSLFATFIGVHHPSYRIGKCKQNAVVPEFRLRTIGIIKITVDKHREHRDAIGRAYLLMVNGKALNGKGRRFIEQYRCDLGISPVYDAACYYQALNEYKSFHCISISLIRSQLHTAATVSLIGRIFASRLRCHLPVASLRRGYGVTYRSHLCVAATVSLRSTWLREAIDNIDRLLSGYQRALLDLAERHADTPLPGFTHLQVAQPVTFGHHLLAYVEMAGRDRGRLADCRRRMNRLPLGAAALAGTSFPIDRESVARELGFDGVCENSLDAVSDRDFAIEFTAAASLLMMHVSRFSEELILWMSPRFGFIDLADRYCTGSSIMPQKKNPDVPELARGKTGRVYGHLMGLLTLMKGQPLAYNKDNQEDKEPLFDTADTLIDTLRIFAELVPGITVRPEAMRDALGQGHATATDLADYLVKRGLPFRDAHEAVARAVRRAEEKGCDLARLSLPELQTYSSLIEADVYSVLTVEGSLAARNHIGGTAPEQVRAAIARVRTRL